VFTCSPPALAAKLNERLIVSVQADRPHRARYESQQRDFTGLNTVLFPVDVPPMNVPALLACGPDFGSGVFLVCLAGIALGGLACTASLLVGFICLFTSKWRIGIWLMLIPAMIVGSLCCFYLAQTRQ
jgi:hypothetical protein